MLQDQQTRKVESCLKELFFVISRIAMHYIKAKFPTLAVLINPNHQ